MLLPADYHIHTPLCRHAVGSPSEYAARAGHLGLAEIGFSDHAPMPRDDFDDWRMVTADLEAYVRLVEQARRDHPQLVIRLALEVDYLPELDDWIRELTQRHPWDYLIGSVHYVIDHWAIDNPSMVSEWRRHDPDEVWRRYVERLTQAAQSGHFDIIGHVDLPKKFGFYPKADVLPLFDEFLRVAAGSGVAVELNTGGLRKECREIYPSRPLLELAFRQGLPITFGSDAHTPDEVGTGFDQAVRLAQAAGYRECCRFAGRRRETVAL
jgi:histidinol-phosphatase (PHP family)